MSPIYFCRVVCVHYPNLSFAIECESSFDMAALCVQTRSGTARGTPAIHIPPSCLSARPWHGEMEKRAPSEMRCKHVYSANSCFAMELFKRLTYIFCQPSRCMSSDLQRRTFFFSPPPPPPTPLFPLSRCLFPLLFFFPPSKVTFWVSFQEEVSSICQTHRE